MRGRVVFVIGVAGCGKSTLAQGLADFVDGAFLEGDDFHPAENVALMRAGQALDDAHRWGWLQELAAAATKTAQNGEDVVVACSGLKLAYRDVLRDGVGRCRMIFLDGSKELILARMSARKGHYMPTSLLDSQFADLELPEPSEPDIFTLSIDPKPLEILSSAKLLAFP